MSGEPVEGPAWDRERGAGDPAGGSFRHRLRQPGTARFLFVIAAVVSLLWALAANLLRLDFPTGAADEGTYTRAGWLYLHSAHLSFANPTDNFEHPPLAKYAYGAIQTLVGHPSLDASRAVAASCTVATGVVLAWWLARLGMRWTGLLAGLLVTVVPAMVLNVDFSFGRYAMLDPVAEFLMTSSIVVAWHWFRSAGGRRWLWALGVGVAVGLATSAKENGFLGVVGPMALGVVFAVSSGVLAFLERAIQAALAAVVACVVFVASYLPVADPDGAIRHLLNYQTEHDKAGHLVGYAGRATMDPAWWANLWWAGRGLGAMVVVATLVGVASALILRHDRLVAWCVAALVGPMGFHLFIARVALPFYYVMWLPFYLTLAAIGIGELGHRARTAGHRVWRTAAGLVCCVALVLCATTAVRGFVRMATLPLTGPWALPKVMHAQHLKGPTMYGGFGMGEYDQHLPGGATTDYRRSLTPFRLIVISTPRCRNTIPPRILAGIEVNEKNGRLREVYTDAKMIVYSASAPLIDPTAEQTNAIPPHNPADGC